MERFARGETLDSTSTYYGEERKKRMTKSGDSSGGKKTEGVYHIYPLGGSDRKKRKSSFLQKGRGRRLVTMQWEKRDWNERTTSNGK